MKKANLWLLSIVLLLISGMVFAQEVSGPTVPCAGIPCEGQEIQPWPETGAWYNPEQSGSGFTIEVQNGRMVSYYYGYDPSGEPTWWQFVAQLEPSEEPGVAWVAEGEPLRFSGGNCFGCEYTPLNEPEPLQSIRMEFLQRANMRLTYPSGEQQFFVPITYGTSSKAYFSDWTDYLFPTMQEPGITSYGELGALWYFVIDYTSTDQARGPWEYQFLPLIISPPQFFPDGRFDRPDEPVLSYALTWYDTPTNALGFGEILCVLREEGAVPGCSWELLNTFNFEIPIGNFTDTRIQGVTATGERFEAIRANMD